MLTDAHCHPFDLVGCLSNAEDERRQLGVMCASSATTEKEFEYCENLAMRAKGGAPLLPCFAIHPQMTANAEQSAKKGERLIFLDSLAAHGRLAAVGETGFDLYNDVFRETEKIQDDLFAAHLDTAIRYDLPIVIHARRAMHKIFSYTALLKKCVSVIFHSWPGTKGEGESLLARGVNAFFSFGMSVTHNRRESIRCIAAFPSDRILTETDAPYQPLRGANFSCYADLVFLLETAAALRREAGAEVSAADLEKQVEENFRAAFSRN